MLLDAPQRASQLEIPPAHISPAFECAGTDGDLFVEFAESHLRLFDTSAAGRAGQPVRIREFQRLIVDCLLAYDDDGLPIFGTGYLQGSKKWGKSFLLAALVVYRATFSEPNEQLVVCARNSQQAGVVFRMVKQLVLASPELKPLFKFALNKMTHKSNGTTFTALSADSEGIHGLSVDWGVVDEFAMHQNGELFDAVKSSTASRPAAQVIVISTPGAMRNSSGYATACYQLYERSKRVASGEDIDARFFTAIWEPVDPRTADHTDPVNWRASCPGFGDITTEQSWIDDLAAMTTPAFLMLRCGMWVESMDAAVKLEDWSNLSTGEHLADDPELRCVLSLDPSRVADATALVVVTCEEIPRIDVVGVWEHDGSPSWTVPVPEVLDAIRLACSRWHVVEVASDMYAWQHHLEALAAEGVPVVKYPASQQRYVAAWQEMDRLIKTHGIAHSGDPALARHVANLTLKRTSTGEFMPSKPKGSAACIDLAIAAMTGIDRARWHAQNVSKPRDWLIA